MRKPFAVTVLAVAVLTSCDKATDPNTPVYLAFADSIGTVAKGAVVPSFRVEFRTKASQVATSDTMSVTLITEGVLNGTTTKPAVNGVVTFTDIVLPNPGTYFLRATATGFATYNSNQFVVTP